MQLVESRSLNISIILHVAAALIAFVGLPVLLPERPEPTPLVMTVEILPITGVTNVKPSDQPIQKEQKSAIKAPKTPEPTVKETPKPTQAEPPKPVEKPVEKTFDPTEGAEPKPKDEPKKEEKKDDTKSDFDKMMEKLKAEQTPPTPVTSKAQPAPVKEGKDKTTAEENKTKSDAPYDASKPMSLSETDAIRSQFIPCWHAPAGAKDAANLAVRVKVQLQQDGTVLGAQISPDQSSRYSSDTYFRAAADAAVRAVHKCSPLKNLPADKYGTWKDMEINFDPKDML